MDSGNATTTAATAGTTYELIIWIDGAAGCRATRSTALGHEIKRKPGSVFRVQVFSFLLSLTS